MLSLPVQYLTMVDLLESIDCMVKNGPYRKFRPDVPVHKNAKHWWKYSMNSILDVHVRRFNQMWSWSNIRKHRHTLKAYRAAYKAKLLTTQGKVREDQEKQIQDLEKSLDVFNITLARQQAQMEVCTISVIPINQKSSPVYYLVFRNHVNGGFVE
uniref:Chorein N-terminal domain-containing protein n=1 Tax=Hucho hucho TaxID=62062 RepID=A0A4W5KFP4_9TELE